MNLYMRSVVAILSQTHPVICHLKMSAFLLLSMQIVAVEGAILEYLSSADLARFCNTHRVIGRVAIEHLMLLGLSGVTSRTGLYQALPPASCHAMLDIRLTTSDKTKAMANVATLFRKLPRRVR